MTARILVFTPTYDDLLQEETVKSIQAMQFDGKFEWVVSDENPYPGRDMRNCVAQFEKGRRLALDGGFDGVLFVEHDMIVPRDALATLWATDAGVAYGAYMLRHGELAVNLFQHLRNGHVGMSLSHYPGELRAAMGQGWVEVSGIGFGCTLIRRDVLERVPFRDDGHAPDLPFAQDCERLGIRQVGRTDVRCGHIDVSNHRILWPFVGGVGMTCKVIALQDVVVPVDGQTLPMATGKSYEVPRGKAYEWVRAGFVQMVEGAGEMETATMPAAETATAPKKRTRTRAKPKAKASE